MKMISAARLARAQQAAEASRAYGAKLTEVFASVLPGVEADAHPLLAPREKKRNLDVVLFTSDRGLCGAYNSNLIKAAMALMSDRMSAFEKISVIAVGKRGRDFFRRKRIEVARSWVGIAHPTAELAHEIGAFLIERYLSGASDETVIVYPRFVSALTQHPTVLTALPIAAAAPSANATRIDYEIEPDPASLLAKVLPGIVDFIMLRALFEQAASEHGARMTAMESATENTREVLRSLTLEMNKDREGWITPGQTGVVDG